MEKLLLNCGRIRSAERNRDRNIEQVYLIEGYVLNIFKVDDETPVTTNKGSP